MNKTTMKSIGAVMAGIVIGIFLTIGTDKILESMYGSANLIAALIYRAVYLAVAGYMISILAPTKPMKHVMIAGFIALVVTILGSIANWKMSSGSEWYPILLIIVTYPATWVGGKIYTSRNNKK